VLTDGWTTGGQLENTMPLPSIVGGGVINDRVGQSPDISHQVSAVWSRLDTVCNSCKPCSYV